MYRPNSPFPTGWIRLSRSVPSSGRRGMGFMHAASAQSKKRRLRRDSIQEKVSASFCTITISGLSTNLIFWN